MHVQKMIFCLASLAFLTSCTSEILNPVLQRSIPPQGSIVEQSQVPNVWELKYQYPGDVEVAIQYSRRALIQDSFTNCTKYSGIEWRSYFGIRNGETVSGLRHLEFLFSPKNSSVASLESFKGTDGGTVYLQINSVKSSEVVEDQRRAICRDE